jgi:hypothetical protein
VLCQEPAQGEAFGLLFGSLLPLQHEPYLFFHNSERHGSPLTSRIGSFARLRHR